MKLKSQRRHQAATVNAHRGSCLSATQTKWKSLRQPLQASACAHLSAIVAQDMNAQSVVVAKCAEAGPRTTTVTLPRSVCNVVEVTTYLQGPSAAVSNLSADVELSV